MYTAYGTYGGGEKCIRHMACMGEVRNVYGIWHVWGRLEMYTAYGTYGGGEKCIQTDFWWEKQMVGGYIEDPGLDSKIILKPMVQRDVAQTRHTRRAVLDTSTDHVSNY